MPKTKIKINHNNIIYNVLINLIGEFQLSNVATAIATLRNIEKLDISDRF